MSAYVEIWGLLTAWAVLQALAPGKAHNSILRRKVWCGHQPDLTLHTGKLMHRGIDISVEPAWSHAWMPESVPLNPALPLSPHPMAPQHPRRVRGSPQCPRGALGWRGSPWAGALLPWLCDSAHLSFPSQAFSVTWSNCLPEARGAVTTTVDPKLLIVHIADGQPRVPIPFRSMPCLRVFIPRVPWGWGRRPLIISQFSIHFHPLELFSWVPSVIRERDARSGYTDVSEMV